MDEAEKIREKIAVLPQDVRIVYYTMTSEDYIRTYIRTRGFSYRDAKAITKESIKKFKLEKLRSRPVKDLSGGEAKRALLAMILSCPDVEIFFLDEPTTGLDPNIRRKVWEILRSKASEGKTIFLTSHYMDEIYKISDEIILLNNGKIIMRGIPESVIKWASNKYKNKIIIKDKVPNWLQDKVRRIGKYSSVYSNNIEEITKKLIHEGTTFEISKMDMEDVFILLEEKEI